MVSLWHAFDLAVSLDSGGASQAAAPVRARLRQLPPWITMELLPPNAAIAHEEAWRALAARALIPNLFAEPEIALAAATHLMQGQSPRILFAWDERGKPRGRLILCAPLVLPSFGVGEVKVWSHDLLSSSLALLDRDDPDLAIDALLEAVRSGPARGTGLRLSHLDETGEFAALVRRAAARGQRDILRFERPVHAPVDPETEEHRGRPMRTAVARSPRKVREAVEHFLAIEALGKAGERGEALLLSPQASAFLRVVTRSLARKRLCHVALRLSQGKPRGADIYLRSGDEDLLWKTAGVGSGAPALQSKTGDSVDWLVAARPGRSPAILAVAARNALSRGLRDVVKRVRGG
jgi:hypothetical protein